MEITPETIQKLKESKKIQDEIKKASVKNPEFCFDRPIKDFVLIMLRTRAGKPTTLVVG